MTHRFSQPPITPVWVHVFLWSTSYPSWENCCVNKGVITTNVFPRVADREDSHAHVLRRRFQTLLLTVERELLIGLL